MPGPGELDLMACLKGTSHEARGDLELLGKRIQSTIGWALVFGARHPGVRVKVVMESVLGCRLPSLPEIYARYFNGKKDGVFVEIGAHDGEQYSNTCGLADLGWSGLYVEPVVESFEKCQKRHAKNPQVRVSNVAVGDFLGEVVVHIAGAWSTTSEEALANFKKMGWWRGEGRRATVQMVTLNRILELNEIVTQFDLLVVDVEGSEWEVIRGFDIDYWKPRMVIIELHDVSLKYEFMRYEYLLAVNFFARHGYRVVYKDLGNTIYVDCEFESRLL